MVKKKDRDTENTFEKALQNARDKHYLLRLYITGTSPRSMRAIGNIKKICEENLKGRYELEIIDVYQQPDVATDKMIVALPTLVKELPQPLRRLIGDLSNKKQVLAGLDIIRKVRNPKLQSEEK
ncbi:MAG TPA: circadian clock KaiB family protein [Desulfomonilia bacterium]|nr:circadian clock KaiB family protein [Desulfomonilia bacterium]